MAGGPCSAAAAGCSITRMEIPASSPRLPPSCSPAKAQQEPQPPWLRMAGTLPCLRQSHALGTVCASLRPALAGPTLVRAASAALRAVAVCGLMPFISRLAAKSAKGTSAYSFRPAVRSGTGDVVGARLRQPAGPTAAGLAAAGALYHWRQPTQPVLANAAGVMAALAGRVSAPTRTHP